MASRRTFLKAGLSATAAGLLARPIFAGIAEPHYYKAIFDERFEVARAFAAGAAERGIPAAAIHGDITRLFFDDLDLRWRQGPVWLAGYTLPASLFCLDLLARDRGMRVVHRAQPDGDSPAPVFWIIAPSRRDRDNRRTEAVS